MASPLSVISMHNSPGVRESELKWNLHHYVQEVSWCQALKRDQLAGEVDQLTEPTANRIIDIPPYYYSSSLSSRSLIRYYSHPRGGHRGCLSPDDVLIGGLQ